MKLAKISHIKCQEHTASTYVWIPDEMTADEFESICGAARSEYLAFENKFKADQPRYPHLNYDNYPNSTVVEAKALHAQAVSEYEAAQKNHEDSRRSFGDWLVRLSGEKIKAFWQGELPIVTRLDWGHNHGTSIEFDETNIADLRRKAKKKPNPIFAFESEVDD